MKHKGRTQPTVLATVQAYDYTEGGWRKSAHLTRNNPILKLQNDCIY